MLGLCWTPASVQGMQKVASTMPSNPEQLLGAILVRKDIFNRFETTMHDTCLDANNLLEYLFSLYNSTAAPAERENHPAGQVLGFVHKDTNCNKKVSGRGQLAFPNLPAVAVGNSHFPHPNIQARSSESRPHQSGINDGHRKKMKLEPSGFPGDVVNLAVNHQDYGQSVSLKPFDNQSNFSGPNSSQAPIVKRELTSSDVESRHAQPPSSSLPPFSQICRQGSRPYSPASAQYAETLATTQHKDGSKAFNMNARADHGSADLKMEVDGAHPGVLGEQAPKNVPNMHKLAKKFKVKGSNSLPADGGSSSNNGERIGRKKKTHQCFCGALFTRADNLKRHIRKCHKEKITGGLLESHVDNSGLPGADDFSHAFPSGGQDGIEASQPLNSHASQPLQAQHHHQQREEHHLQQREEHHLQQREEHHLQQREEHHLQQREEHHLQQREEHHLQQREEHHLQQREEHHLQQREEHHLQQREEHRLQQREEHHHQPQDNSVVKSTAGVKWSCFCGENFDDHYRLVQHTRTHEGHL